MQLAAVIRAMDEKMGGQSYQPFLAEMTEILADLLYVSAAAMWLVEPGADDLVLQHFVDHSGRNGPIFPTRLPRQSCLGQALDTWQPVGFPPLSPDLPGRGQDSSVIQQWGSTLVVPLCSMAGEPQGMLAVAALAEERTFTAHDRHLMATFACHLVTLLQQKDFYRQAQRRRAIQQIRRAALHTTDLHALSEVIVEQAMALFADAGGILCLVHEKLQELLVYAASCSMEQVRDLRIPLQSQDALWRGHTREVLRCSGDDPRLAPHLAQQLGPRACAIIPLALEEQVLGTLIVFQQRTDAAPFAEADLALLQSLVPDIAEALNTKRLDIMAQRRAKHLRVINEILAHSTRVVDIQTLLQQAAQEINQAFGYLVDVGLIEEQTMVFKATAAQGSQAVASQVASLPIGQGITGHVAFTGALCNVPDVHKDPRYYASSPETRSELVVPLLSSQYQRQGRCVGVLNIESKVLGDFSSEDEQLFAAIAASLALAIDNTQQRKTLSAFHQISSLLSDKKSEQILSTITDTLFPQVVQLCNADAGALHLVTPDGQSLRLVAHTGLSDEMVALRRSLKQGQSIAGKVWKNGEPLLILDLATDPRVDQTLGLAQHFRSLADVPITFGADVLGVLAIATKDTRRFTQYDFDILGTIGRHLGSILGRAQLYQQVAEAGRQFQQLYETSRDPILLLQSDFTIRQANTEALRLSDCTLDELLGKDVLQLIAEPRLQELARTRLTQASQGERLDALEFPLCRKDGSVFFVESSLTPVVNATGEVVMIQAIWRDVTRRREADEQIRRQNRQLETWLETSRIAFRAVQRKRLLEEIAEQALSLLASDRCYIHLRQENSDTLEPFVFPPLESLHQRWPGPLQRGVGMIGEVAAWGQGRIANHVHEEEDALSEAYRTESPPQHFVSMPLKSHTQTLGVISVTRWGHQAQPYDAKDADRLEGLANGLTLALEHRRLEDIQHKQRAAQKVLEQVSLFGSFLGHKMGGFLGAVSLSATELARQIPRPDDPMRPIVENLLLSSQTASRLITQFRSMEKPLLQPLEDVALAPLVQTAVAQAQVPKYINLDLGRLDDLPIVHASPPLLVEVFEGLIRNASEATPGFGTVSIHGTMSLDGSEIRLAFTDTGSGMSRATLHELFTPFFSTKKQRGGVGLGLWLSRLYLQAAGGDIVVTSEVGRGTTITVHLPVGHQGSSSSQKRVTQATPPEPQVPVPVVATPEGRPRVLVVEDDPLWRGILSPMLQLRGCEVRLASTYDEGLKALWHKQSFNAFIFDIRLAACRRTTDRHDLTSQNAPESTIGDSAWVSLPQKMPIFGSLRQAARRP